MRSILFLLAIVLAVAAGLSYYQRTSAVAVVRDTAQELFDEKIEANALKVGYVEAPTLARIPIFGQSTWRSYLFITDREGNSVDLAKCPATADYEVRFSDRELFVTVFGMDRLRQCSRAIM